VDGKIQLALRNPLDLARINPDAVRRESLYGASSAPPIPEPAPKPAVVRAPAPKAVAPPPAPVVPPPAAPVVVPPAKLELQLIQGSKSEKVVFEKKVDLIAGPQGQ